MIPEGIHLKYAEVLGYKVNRPKPTERPTVQVSLVVHADSIDDVQALFKGTDTAPFQDWFIRVAVRDDKNLVDMESGEVLGEAEPPSDGHQLGLRPDQSGAEPIS